MSDSPTSFDSEKAVAIEKMANDTTMRELSQQWFTDSCRHRYSYNFSWMGRPIIQYPQDILAMQELIWQLQPDAIVETGIAHGGSLIFYASMLELLGGDRKVLGIDIDIRAHNKVEIENHRMSHRIEMIEGSSIDAHIVEQACAFTKGKKNVLVILDSNHTHEYVLRELEFYSPLVQSGSYMVVFDTVVENLPDDLYGDRPWGVGNNPMTAVHEFLKSNDRFTIDRGVEDKILLTVAPGGYLKCIKNTED